MFREMVRKHLQLPERECLDVLRQEPRGVLSVLGDDGYPYGMPMDHWYNEEDGHLYFHSGPMGHKVDALKNCDKVSYCVFDKGFVREGEWALNIRSVIVFGRMRVVEDRERAIELVRKLSYKYTDDETYIEGEIKKTGKIVLVYELIPEHMTGKLVNES
ncbi:MAG: pyridoxamine 5'-phosphate oxidase family protein [Ruminococcaceae bacterium]|nr:pyridoxamine 5'-phosphate oxidase family protein [Oscillospiraceae bacterium]